MIELNKNQKIIVGGILLVIILVIGYYIYKITQEPEINTLEIMEDKVEIAEENQNIDNTEIIIHIAGAVENSGIQKLHENSRIADAIEAAGGLTADANINSINLAQKIIDGQKIYIPSIDDDEITETVVEMPVETMETVEYMDSININTASQTELETLPGIGPSTASKIIEYRKENGKFSSIEDVQNVSGIGESKYAQIKDKIVV